MANKYTSNEASNGYGIGNDAYNSIAKVYDGTNGPSYTITGGIADSASGADTLIVNGTTHDQGATQLVISKSLTVKPEIAGNVITGSNATSVLRVNGSVAMTLGAFTVQNTATTKTAIVDNASTGALNNHIYNGLTINGTGATQSEYADYGFNDTWTWGCQIFNDITFAGYCKQRLFNCQNLSVSSGREKTIKFNGVNLDSAVVDRAGVGATYGIHIEGPTTPGAGTWSVQVSRVTGQIAPSVSADNLIAIHVSRIPGSGVVTIADNDFSILTASTSNTRGIVVKSDNAAAPVDAAVISNNKFTYNYTVGHGISVGLNAATNYVTNTKLISNHVTGPDSSTTATPHNITFAQSTTGTFSSGNISEKGYVGYLHEGSGVTQQSDMTKDVIGPHYYLKGASNSVIQNCIGCASSNTSPHTFKKAFVTLTSQGSIDCGSGNIIRNNLFLISDMSALSSLASIEPQFANASLPQLGIFSNNTYVIPDTVDVSTALLFGWLTSTPTDTLATWNTRTANAGGTAVTNEKIIQKPATEIEAMISDYYNRAAGGSGSGLWLEVAPGINVPL